MGETVQDKRDTEPKTGTLRPVGLEERREDVSEEDGPAIMACGSNPNTRAAGGGLLSHHWQSWLYWKPCFKSKNKHKRQEKNLVDHSTREAEAACCEFKARLVHSKLLSVTKQTGKGYNRET